MSGHPALGIDVYQLTTLAAHARLGRLGQQVHMGFFFRRLPKQRNYVVFTGLRAILEQCQKLRFDEPALALLRGHQLLGPLLDKHPEVVRQLAAIDGFRGEIEALPEGTLAFAGPAHTSTGELLRVGGAPLKIYTPLLQVRTSLTLAKLIETPWLSRINHMSMVASKTARIVTAAAGRPVLEFGQRRTHHAAAVDAAYAAYLAGCSASSNLAAEAAHGVPSTGTMDHFAVQASEQPGLTPEQSERQFFETFVDMMPATNTLLVDTYDTPRGLRLAAQVAGTRLSAVRLDSNVSPQSIAEARRILDEHGAPQAKIFCSDGLDEHRVAQLVQAGADGFGVGENIACSPDAATGVGAVGKITVNGYGALTMKLSRGSGKATLPGRLQVWRGSDHDWVALHDEPGPSGARPLLVPVWQKDAPVGELPSLQQSRQHVAEQLRALPSQLRGLDTDHGQPWRMVASDRLVDLVRRLAAQAGVESSDA